MTGRMPALPVFTSLRFFAAAMVVLHHYQPFMTDPRFAGLKTIQREGYAGVAFFFLLSGFILAWNYQSVFRALGVRKVIDFYTARFARIYPVHILSLLVLCVLNPVLLSIISSTWKYLLAYLSLTQAFVPYVDCYFGYNAVAWSLSNEMFFYAVFPFVLWGMLACRLNSPLKAACAAILVWGIAFAYNWTHRTSPGYHWSFYIDPLFRLQDFLVGVCLALVTAGCRTRGFRAPPRWLATLGELGAVAALVAAIYYSDPVPYSVRLGSYYTPFMAIIVLCFASQSGYLSRFLSLPLFRFLGEISFSTYMFHVLVMQMMANYKPYWGLESFGTIQYTWIYFGALLTVSSLCYICYETPMRIGLKLMLAVKPKPVAPLLRAVPLAVYVHAA